jgi:hypothetical protein
MIDAPSFIALYAGMWAAGHWVRNHFCRALSE